MRIPFVVVVAAVIALSSAVSPPARAIDPPGAQDGVPLNLCDVIVRPGRPLIVGIRTCQPRGLSQGQVLIRRPQKPMSEPRRTVVFSLAGDAATTLMAADATSLYPAFLSPSATVNTLHGPFLAILLRPESNLAPGDSFALEIEPTATALFDSTGEETPFTTRGATITVCEPDAPYLLAVGDTAAPAGLPVAIPVVALEMARFARLETVFRFDPAFFVRRISAVAWDVRGDVEASFVDLGPGEIFVAMDSPRGSIGLMPGAVFEIEFEVSAFVIEGDSTTITLDAGATRLVDRSGEEAALELRAGAFTVVRPGA